MSLRSVALPLSVLFALSGLSACAGSGGGAEAGSAPAEKAAPATPIPSGHVLGKVQVGMSDTDVRQVLGEPTSQNSYITGKSFIPFYYGPDTARTDYVYAGKGRVVFSRNRWSGALKVIDVRYDPSL